MKLRSMLPGFIALVTLAIAGCKVTGTGSVNASCGGGKPCTVGGTVGISVSNNFRGFAPSDLSGALSSGYAIIVHVPDADVTYSGSSQPQATLTATTDTGYTSSFVVNLTPAGSAPSSLYASYTAYTFNVQPSSQLTAWVNTVNAHTTSTSSMVTVSSTSFEPQGESGTYTIYAQFTSTQTGTVSVGSSSFTDPGSDPSCTPGTGPNKLSCGPGTGI